MSFLSSFYPSFTLRLSISPSLHLSISPSLHLSISPSLHLSISLSLRPSVCHQIGEYLILAWMRVDPRFNPLNFIEAFVAEFLAIKLFLGAARFLAADLILPGRGEDHVDVLVQVAGLERLPFVLVEPDSAAITALIEREAGPVADAVFDQNLVALRAEFGDQRAGHRIEGDRLSLRRSGQALFVLFAPFPVFERRNPISAAFIAMARSQIAFERGKV